MNSLFQKPLSFEKDFPLPSYSDWEKLAETIYKSAIPTNEYPYEMIAVKPLYIKNDQPHKSIFIDGKDAKNCLIVQEIININPADYNTAIINALNGGAEAISLPLNISSLYGLDRKNDSLNNRLILHDYDDFNSNFKNIPLEECRLYLQSGFSGMAILAFLWSYIDRQGLSPNKITGSVEMDPLWILGRFGQMNAPIDRLYDEMAALVKWSDLNMPNVKTIGVNASYLHESGASAVQELAFALSTAAEYIRALLERKVSIKDIVRHFSFSVSVGSDFFMDIAKLRAFRLLWANLIEAFAGSGEMEINCRTSEREKINTEPHTNIIRNTLQSMAAIIGGSDSITVVDFTDSDDFTQRIARNIPLILKNEARFNTMCNAASGSFFIESLIGKIMEKSWDLFQEIEKEGGYYSALRKGFPQKEIKKTLNKRKTRLSLGEDKLVGVNVYRKEEMNDINKKKSGDLQIILENDLTRNTTLNMDKMIESVRNGKTMYEIYWQNGTAYLQKVEPMCPIHIEEMC